MTFEHTVSSYRVTRRESARGRRFLCGRWHRRHRRTRNTCTRTPLFVHRRRVASGKKRLRLRLLTVSRSVGRCGEPFPNPAWQGRRLNNTGGPWSDEKKHLHPVLIFKIKASLSNLAQVQLRECFQWVTVVISAYQAEEGFYILGLHWFPSACGIIS